MKISVQDLNDFCACDNAADAAGVTLRDLYTWIEPEKETPCDSL